VALPQEFASRFEGIGCRQSSCWCRNHHSIAGSEKVRFGSKVIRCTSAILEMELSSRKLDGYHQTSRSVRCGEEPTVLLNRYKAAVATWVIESPSLICVMTITISPFGQKTCGDFCCQF